MQSAINSSKRCLVTGGNGFIGAHLVARLAAQGHDVIVFDRARRPARTEGLGNVRFEQGELISLLADGGALQGVDTVFHLAWAHVPESATQHPVGDIQANLIATVRLLQACVEAGVRRIVFASTGGAIYGPVRQLPVPESHPTHPISAYGVTKLAAEKYIELYYHLHGLEYAILRPSVCYGPGQDPFGRQGAIAVFMGRILNGQPITIWGDGDAIVRDFFHVADLARACELAMLCEAPAAVLNIGGGAGISLTGMIEMLSAIVGAQHAMAVERMPARPFDVPQLVLDIRQAQTVLGWQPEIDLMGGLTSTWQWYRDVWFPQTQRPGATR